MSRAPKLTLSEACQGSTRWGDDQPRTGVWRIACPWCGKDVALTPNGRIRRHRAAAPAEKPPA